MSERQTNFSEPLGVRAGCHVRVDLNIPSPPGAELVVEHLVAENLLARECRPLKPGHSFLDIKTHPRASHIACSLLSDGNPVDGVRFRLHCGQSIEPIARHFIVIGAMKAGTTTLFELLAQHPSLCRTWAEVPGVSFCKEINYFKRLYRKGDTPLHYDWRFPFEGGTHAWTLDVSPNYAKWPWSRAVPARIASLGGEIKLAYILREPVDRIESHLAHAKRAGRQAANLQHCISTSRYAMQLDKFVEHIEREKVLLLDFEQLQCNPLAILAQICDFLGIERFASRSGIHNRRSTKFRLEARQRVELADILRPDVQRLISMYGFTPAERWLRRPALGWIRRPNFLK